MGKGLAILKDSFRETLDCKTFWILLAVSTLLILVCGSISFEALSPEEALQETTSTFNVVYRWPPKPFGERAEYEVDLRVEEVTKDEAGVYAFRLVASPGAEFHRVVRHQQALDRKLIKGVHDPVPQGNLPISFEAQERYLKTRLMGKQMKRIEIRADTAKEGDLAYQIQLQPWNEWSLGGAHRVSVLFGLWSDRTGQGGAAGIVFFLQWFFTQFFATLCGVPIAIIFTAFFIPDMLNKGRIDTLISRPISRPALLCWKFLGGLLYVFLNAAYLVGGCWLALAVRSGQWDPSFLWVIVMLTASFAVVYAFCTWLAVLTRSAVVSLLCTLGVVVVSWAVGLARNALSGPESHAGARRVVGVVHAVLPKTYDLFEVNQYFMGRGTFGDKLVGVMQIAREPEWALLLVSSGAFLALFLSLACITFSKKDY